MELTEATLSPEAIYRSARKPWRCICADPVKRWQVKGTYGRGWYASTARSEAEADEIAENMRRRGATVAGTPFDSITIEAVPNPDYRPDCVGDIAPGDRYVEYMGEAAAYASGTRYCLPCGVAVWAES